MKKIFTSIERILFIYLVGDFTASRQKGIISGVYRGVVKTKVTSFIKVQACKTPAIFRLELLFVWRLFYKRRAVMTI